NCGLDRSERMLRIVLVPIEKVFRVKVNLFPFRFQKADGFADHSPIFIYGNPQDLLHMELPTLADNRNHRRFRGYKKRDLRVVGGLGVGAASAPKSADSCLAPLTTFYGFKERDVFGIGPRPSTFNIVNSKRIEFLSNTNLVVDTEGNAFSLRSVAQSRIVDHD